MDSEQILEIGNDTQIDPAVLAAQVETNEVAETEVAEQANIEQPAAKEPEKKTVPLEVMLERVSRAKKSAEEAAEARIAAAERKAAEAEALAARALAQAQAGNTETQKQAPQLDPNDPGYRAAVKRDAEAQRFYENTLEVKNRGLTEYGQGFNQTLNILGSLATDAPTFNAFISDVLVVDKDKAHEILTEIARDPERAVVLCDMNSGQRIRELTKMSLAKDSKPVAEVEVKPAAKAAPAKTVSKAPAPPPPLASGGTKTLAKYADELTDAEFKQQVIESWGRRAGR